MKILFVHHTSDLYGAGRSLLRLAARLRADGHEITAVLPGTGPLFDEMTRAGIDIELHAGLTFMERRAFTPLGLLRLLLAMPRSVFEIARIIRKRNVDLVHTNVAVIVSSPLAALLTGRPHVWHIREFFSEFPTLWPIHRSIMRALSGAIVAVSDAVARQFGEPDGRSRVHVIHDGFPIGEFEGISQARIARFRSEFGLNGSPVAGVVGRIKLRRKGQEIFVEAAARLAGRHPDAKFLMIGSPFPGNEEHLAELERMIARLGLRERVVYTGDVADIKAAFASLDVSVLPTALPEPFGGVVIESMAMAKPVVATSIGGTVEQVVDGVTGLLVDADDPDGLAEAMDKLLADAQLRAEMGARGRQRFVDNFEFEPFYAKVTELYSELVRS